MGEIAQTGHMQPLQQKEQGIHLATTTTGLRLSPMVTTSGNGAVKPGYSTSAMAPSAATTLAAAISMCVQCVLSSHLTI